MSERPPASTRISIDRTYLEREVRAGAAAFARPLKLLFAGDTRARGFLAPSLAALTVTLGAVGLQYAEWRIDDGAAQRPAHREWRPHLYPNVPPSSVAEPSYVTLASDPKLSQLYQGAKRGDAEALRELRRCAALKIPEAQIFLAQLHETGAPSVPKDLSKARVLLERAAAEGDLRAVNNLALYASRGEGGPQDNARALQLWRRAAEGGVTESQFNLALQYLKGASGLPRDETRARYWFEKAAAAGDSDAKLTLRVLNDSTVQSDDKALAGFSDVGPKSASALPTSVRNTGQLAPGDPPPT